jgi:hypothetical protein
VTLSAVPPEEPHDVPLSDAEWDALAALQTELDLGSPGPDTPDGPFVGFIRRLVVWLWWLLDPKAEGLPMPPLRDPERHRRRSRERLEPERPAGA